jgi:flagellar basal-body rod protein FlgF
LDIPRSPVPGTLGDMDGMDWMASAMRAAQAQLDTATHNLANVASDGYRRVRSSLTLTGRGLVAREVPDPAQGGIRETGRPLDLALLGPGAFSLAGFGGRMETRAGAFERDREGYLSDQQGRRVQGRSGPIRLSETAVVGADGTIRDGGRVAGVLPLPPGTTVRSGALESSSVDAIGETLAVLTSQRAFETAQKTFGAIDEARDKAVNDVGRLK